MDGELSRSLIITAGGFGKRMNSEIPKQFLLLQGKPVLQRTIEAFYTFDSSMEIIVVLPETWSNHWEELCHKFEMAVEHRVVIGGSERFYSVKNAIEHATGELVAVHDGVRPLVSQKTIERCFESAQINRASVPVLPVNESVRKMLLEGNKSVDRKNYFLVQTPQVFHRKQLIEAYNQDYSELFTDDASVVEALGVAVHMVIGNEENIKITTQKDLKFAEFLLQEHPAY